MDVQLALMVKKIIVKTYLNNVAPQLSGFPQRKLVNQRLDIVQVALIYQALLVSLMCLASMVKHGIQNVLCVFAQTILSGMEISVFLVQVGKYGFLERVVSAVKDNFSLDPDAKL